MKIVYLNRVLTDAHLYNLLTLYLIGQLIIGYFNSAANKYGQNGDTNICLSRKHCGKRRNYSLGPIPPFPTKFSKAVSI